MQARTFSTPLLVNPVTKHYAWGKRGTGSLVARLSGGQIADQPYAELWFGDHPSGASKISWSDGTAAFDELTGSYATELLGAKAVAAFGQRLPFLFKVLSIGEPLSIQLHPTRAQAVRLNRRDPVLYPDTTHKPEIAIALSKFSALHGFRVEIGPVLESNLAWKTLLGEARAAELRALLPKAYSLVLRQLVGDLFGSDAERLTPALSQTIVETDPLRRQWRTDLARRYPTDPGVLLFDLMNLVLLQPGDALITAAGVPHAYLEGEILECMANSDNVVRAAFTTKPKDIEALLEIAVYQASPESPGIAAPSGSTRIYPSPAAEFSIAVFQSGTDTLEIEAFGPRLVVCIEGEVRIPGLHTSVLRPGQGAFVPVDCREIRAVARGTAVSIAV